MSSDSAASSLPLTDCPAWLELAAHHKEIQQRQLRDLFAEDQQRGKRYTTEAAGIFLDYSKNRINDKTIKLLMQLAEQRGLRQRMEAMFRGDKINTTEQRAVLHVALRSPIDQPIIVDGVNVVAEVHAVLEQMAAFCAQVRSGQWRGHSGKRIRNIINIGIGGSDLGPAMAYKALQHYSQRDLHFGFIANVDGSDFAETTRELDPEETLFIVCSKTFTTEETLSNARAARHWIVHALGDESAIKRHFVAVSSNADETAKFGIDSANTFPMWDWVGGRYSLGSAVGLSTMLAIGAENFRAMLAGFRAMDEHFCQAPFGKNMPILMGMLSIWYNNFFGAQTAAVLPYDYYLGRFPAYLQQLIMESNGKQTTLDGSKAGYQTGPIIWGEPGSNSQHSFFQLIHQGSQLVPCDFIGFCQSQQPIAQQHAMLMANMFAQSQALAFGKTPDELRIEAVPDALLAHRSFEGNRPSNTILAERLTPHALGALVALYEHSVFTQGVIWNIDSFDQWGVELGKQLAKRMLHELEAIEYSPASRDSSTDGLIRRYRRLNGLT